MKRIISLLLVIVMSVGVLSSCAFNYAKEDMASYAEFDVNTFKAGLVDGIKLVIDDGDFGLDEDERKNKVKDTILTALAALATKKYTSGVLGEKDTLTYCYYVTANIDGVDYVFYADKMQESKATTLQLGLTTLEKFDKALAEKVASLDISDLIYSTNSAYVASGDKVYVSYTESYEYGDEATKVTEKVTYKLVTVDDTTALGKLLAGTKVGATYEFETQDEKRKVGEAEYTVDVKYTDLVIDEKFSSKDEGKVVAGDLLYITYTHESSTVTTKTNTKVEFTIPADTVADTKTFAGQLIGAEVNKELSVKAIVNGNVTESYAKVIIDSIKGGAEGDKVKAGDTVVISYDYSKSESAGKKTYTNTTLEIPADAKKDNAKPSFTDQLVGATIGSTATISNVVTENQDGSKTTDTYTSVKVNWVVESDLANEITLDYVTYPKADNKDKVEVSAVDGTKKDLRDVTLTYHIFPVWKNDVKALDAKTVLEKYYSAVGSYTEEELPEDADKDAEPEKTYNFDSVQSGNYKKGDDTLLSLVETLATLQSELTTANSDVSSKLTSLKTAQKAVDSATEPTTTQNTNLTKAITDYNNSVKTQKEKQAAVDAQIAKILECTNDKGGDIQADLIADYEKYTYKTLEDKYLDEIKNNLAKAIYTYGAECLTKYLTLPRKAVMEAYRRIEDSHKTDFYAKPTSTTSTTETNYKKFGGDFDLYLKSVYFKDDKNYETIPMQKVYDAIGLEAEQAVRDLIFLYVLVDAVSEIYGEDVSLTKDEIKDSKDQAEQMEQFYMYYLGSTVDFDENDFVHAAQLDKVLDFLLEEKETDELRVEFEHIKYDFKKDEAEDDSND